jgi:hypothetical protein
LAFPSFPYTLVQRDIKVRSQYLVRLNLAVGMTLAARRSLRTSTVQRSTRSDSDAKVICYALNKNWLRLSMNPALGDGGTCYGDSGGPNFLGAGDTETKMIVGITSTGDTVCRATNVTYRVDTPSARAFLGLYVALP